mmetsp:Transcript_61980/g.189282  ORF Transcript_61980/g.189282 Transcript_61980/m.189282 type:complete len:231 (-) Transcript_61980:501-1193(-)
MEVALHAKTEGRPVLVQAARGSGDHRHGRRFHVSGRQDAEAGRGRLRILREHERHRRRRLRARASRHRAGVPPPRVEPAGRRGPRPHRGFAQLVPLCGRHRQFHKGPPAGRARQLLLPALLRGASQRGGGPLRDGHRPAPAAGLLLRRVRDWQARGCRRRRRCRHARVGRQRLGHPGVRRPRAVPRRGRPRLPEAEDGRPGDGRVVPELAPGRRAREGRAGRAVAGQCDL